MIQALIFDLDGTLLNTLQDLTNACNFALVELGLPLRKKEEVQLMIGNGKHKLIERILPKGYEALHDIALKYYDSYYPVNMLKETRPYEGMEELLRNAKEKGIKLGVVTNKSDNFAQKMMNHYFPGIFDVILGGDNGRPLKPDPQSLNELIEKIETDRENILYIGDSDVDIITGRNAGVKTCGVTWGYRSEEVILKEKPDHIAHNRKELGEIIYAE